MLPKLFLHGETTFTKGTAGEKGTGLGLPFSHDIIEAENGEEALKLIEKTAPHLILTDIEMPLMNGYELLEHIRKNPATKSTPVIIITSSSNVEDREKAFQLGADDFVSKPLVIEDLLPRVRRFVT